MGLLDSATNYTFKCTAVSAFDNPTILSGKPAHGGVALFWKNSINDFVAPLEEIDSDRIVGIRCEFGNNDPLFILGVYLPSSSHQMDVFNECFDYLWALYDSLSAKGSVNIMGHLNGDLGNSLGGRGKYEANDRGLKILDFINFFNLCPVNLLSSSCGPLETFVAHSGRYKSTLDYILLPSCLFDSIIFCKTFDKSVDNASDHLPVTLKTKYHFNSHTLDHNDAIQNHAIKSIITRSSFSKEEIDNSYSVPLMNELNTLALDEYNSLACSSDAIITLLTKHASSLARPICRNKTKDKV